jgi:hypothetical protein
MIDVSAAGRAGISDEVRTVGALLLGRDGAFTIGSDLYDHVTDEVEEFSLGSTLLTRKASSQAHSAAGARARPERTW